MATAPSEAAHEGGAGGKFRKRPFRRAPATPYDRPPSVVRVASAAASAARGEGDGAGSGWLSRIVDPASRIVARSASKFYESVFRKRLTVPPDASESKHKPREEVLNRLCNNLSCELQGEKCNKGNNAISDHDSYQPPHAINSLVDGTSELEQLLKQKMFTRIEFDRLTELLRSRTVEPSALQDLNSGNKENNSISRQTNNGKQSVTEQKILQLASNDVKDKRSPSEQEASAFVGLHGNNTSPAVGLVTPDKEAASPAEIAKAYMGSRSSKGFPASLGVRNPLFEEDRALSVSTYTEKQLDPSLAPRSSVSFASSPDLTKNSYMTPRLHGKSSIYKMSRSPFFKTQRTSNDRRSLLGQHLGPSSSHGLASNIMQCDGKQTKKRGSSVLDDDMGSLGSTRRVKQKSHMMLTSKDTSFPGHFLSSPLALSKDVYQQFRLSNKKLGLDEQGHNIVESTISGKVAFPSSSIAPIPPQSSEMARKILEQLDKLMPSPRERLSKVETTCKDESSSRLTHNMLHERALKSMEDIDSSIFLSSNKRDGLDASSELDQQSLISISQKQENTEKDGRSNLSEIGVKVTSETVHVEKPNLSAPDVKSSMESEAFATLKVDNLKQKPAFHISAPEDFFEFDDDDDDDVIAPPKSAVISHEKLNLIVEDESTRAERKLHKPDESSAEGVPIATMIRQENSEKKAFEMPDTERNNGLLFSAAPILNSSSELPSVLTVSTTINQGLVPEKAKVADSTFKFGLKETHAFAPTSTTIAFSESLGGSNFTPKIQVDGLHKDAGGKNLKAVDLSNSLGTSAASLFSRSTSSDLATIGVATTSSLSNGLAITPSTVSVSVASVLSNSDTSVASAFSTTTTSTISSTSSSFSSAALSTVSSLHVGPGHAISAPTAATLSFGISDSANAQEGPVKASSLGIISSITPGSSAAIRNTESSSFGFTTSSAGDKNLSFPSGSSQSLFTSGATAGSQETQSGNGNISSSNHVSSMSTTTMFGLSSSSSSASSSSLFGSSTFSTKPLGSVSGFSFSASSGGSSLSSGSSTSFAPATAFSSSSGFAFSSSAVTSSTSGGRNTFVPPVATFGSSFSSSSSTAAVSSSTSGSSTSFVANTSSPHFNQSFQTTPSSIFGSTVSTTSSPSTGFSFTSSAPSSGSSSFTFGASSAPSSGSSLFTFGASSASPFSFTSPGSTNPAMTPSTQPVFGATNQLLVMNSGSPGNDQMNVEVSMADEPAQSSFKLVSTFGQPANAPATPFVFGSPTVTGGSSVFQFGNSQSTSIPQNPSPFQPVGSLDFAAGGSFSLGSGAGDKSNRKIVKVRRDKYRKK